jgi:hypothetical protein
MAALATVSYGDKMKVSVRIAALLCLQFSTIAQPVQRQSLHGHVPGAVAHLAPVGRLESARVLTLAIGLPVRDQAGLTALLQRIYDPASPDYHHYLTPRQFTDQFGPTEQSYQAVIRFAKANGMEVVATHGNRVLLDVRARAADVERAFQVTLHSYWDPVRAREFFAPDVEPSIDSNVPILDISGLNNYAPPRPASHRRPAGANAVPASGTGPSGNYWGYDFRNAYVPGTPLDGSGQIVGLVEFDGYYSNDIIAYENKAGLSNSVPLQNILLDGFNGTPVDPNGGEVPLDIEMAIAMAPGLAGVAVFEAGPGGHWNDILSSMATNTQIKQFSSSWGDSGGPDATMNQILQQIAAQGQSFFQASGDGEAWVGPIWRPGDNPWVTSVGGATLTMNGSGTSYASETVWNWGHVPPGWSFTDNGYTGTGSGVSTFYSIPVWQQGVSMSANGGSTTMRNIPDVALIADNIWVIYGNGKAGSFGGTSCAAPLWAGLIALVNQQAAGNGSPTVGFINPAIYALGNGPGYSNCFHDITLGNNTWSGSPTNFYAVAGYDLCAGWGTPNGTNLINALFGTNLPTSVTWANPAPISYGTALSSNQLNATDNVPGSFAYSPTNGTVLNAGTNTLSVIFTPTDTVDYSSTTTSVSIVVWPASLTVAAANASRAYGQTNPVFTGTITGIQNGDDITATYGCSADTDSPVGTYPIVPSLLDPDNRLGNYTVTTNNGILTVTCPAVGIDLSPPTLPAGIAGATYTQTLTASGGAEPYSFTNTGGSLPAGLSLSGGGVLSGTPSVGGTNTFTVTVTDSNGCNGSQAYTLVVGVVPAISSQPASQTNPVVSTATFTVTATGSEPLSYQWQLNGASLTDNERITGSQSSTLTISNLMFTDAGNYVVAVANAFGSTYSQPAFLTVAPAYGFTNFAGLPGVPGTNNGTGSAALFNGPAGVVVYTNNGTVYVADGFNDTIRKVTSAGVVTTLAGSPGVSGSSNGTGTAALFNGPAGVAVDTSGNVYVADAFNCTIRKVTTGGVVTTLAGSPGVAGTNNGTGSAALFYYPAGVAVDSAHNVYVADALNNTIRKITSAGVVTTLAGSAGNPGSADGTGSAARFYYPVGVTLDTSGNLYVADYYNCTIRKVTSAGVVTTLAGSAGNPGSADGTGSAALFNGPAGVAVDSAHNVFVTDSGNNTIRKVTSAGVVTTVGGTAGVTGTNDDVGAAAQFNLPTGVALDRAGNLYIGDLSNDRVTKGTLVNEGLAKPVLTWTNPAAITYGAALGTNQLNATASVTGTNTYSPAAGKVLGAGTNTLSVVFTPTDKADYASVTGTVSLVVLSAPLTVTASNATRMYGQTNPVFTGTITGVTNGDNITATYTCAATPGSPPSTYLITPSLSDPKNRLSNYLVTTNNGTLTVTKAAGTVLLGNLGQTYDGTAKSVSVTTAPPGLAVDVTYNAWVNAPTNAGSYTVIGTINDPNYQGSATNTLVIGPAGATVTANNATLAYGQSNPGFTGTTAGFLSGDNITATYSCSATTNSPPGTYPIVPSLLDPNSRLANYTVATNNGTLTVLQAVPLLTWAVPAPITYGTALGSNQLNATASVAGSFDYSPTNGAVLDAGTNTLSVNFTPTDTIDYSNATSSVSLVVLPPAIPPVIQAVGQSGGSLTFTWSATPGQMYQVQYNPDLSQTNWTALGDAILATNSTVTASDAMTNSQMFYRIVSPP